MRNYITSLLIFSALNAKAQEIKEFDLQSDIVHEIKVGFNKGVTTVMFPSAIQGIYGANVVFDSELANHASFLGSFVKGNYYFSIRALKEKAKGSLNIVYNRRIYIFSLETSDGKYDGSVTMSPSASSGVPFRKKYPSATPSVLLSLLDIAKAYPLFKKYHPERVTSAECKRHVPSPEIKMEYKDFDITLKEVFRFTKYDALVFSVMLTNKTKDVLTYDPRLFSVKVENRIFYPTLSDATGSIPPETQTPAYFVICGSPEGGRNNLAVDNDWSIYLTVDRFADQWKDKRKYIDKILEIKRTESAKEEKEK